jgi:hypothetical protein
MDVAPYCIQIASSNLQCGGFHVSLYSLVFLTPHACYTSAGQGSRFLPAGVRLHRRTIDSFSMALSFKIRSPST